MKYGAADGHGRYGVLDADEEGRLICHECGRSWLHLGTHVRQAHGLMPAEYRDSHGLGVSTSLVSSGLADRMRQSWQRHEPEHLAVLEAARDPERARESSPVGHTGSRGTSRAEVLAGYQARARARRGRTLTLEEVESLGDGLDLQAWADAARVLLSDPAVSSRSLAEACDIAPATVQQRLRRYPARGTEQAPSD